MQPVDFGNPRRQRFQMQPLDGEQFPRHGADVFLVSRALKREVDAVAPLPRLLIEIVPGGERAPGEKVVFDEGKRSEKASISGTGSISLPVPRSTTTCVLSIITRCVAPPK